MIRAALPPGPKDRPLVQAYRFGRDPYGYLEREAANHGPVFTMRLPGDPPRIVVSEPSLIRQIFSMKPDEALSSRWGIPVNLGKHTLLFLDGELHRRDRQLLMPALHGARLGTYAQTMGEVTRAAVAGLRPGERVDLHRLLQDITLEIILRCVFGLREREQLDRVGRPVTEWLDGTFVPAMFFVGMVFGWNRVRDGLDAAVTRALDRPKQRGPLRALPWNRVGRAKAEVVRYLRDDLEACRTEAAHADRTDILALLAHARYEDGSPMATDHAVDELVTMLVGGHETTANTLGWTLSHILPRPAILAEIQAELATQFGTGPVDPTRCNELKYLDACIDESMRSTPIAPAVHRTLGVDYQLGDWNLPAGVILFPSTYITHHRPDLWPEPHEFRPERFLSDKIATERFFPFGGGRRTCIGMMFARFEMRIVLATLLANVDLRLVDPTPKRPMIRGLTTAPHELMAVVSPG